METQAPLHIEGKNASLKTSSEVELMETTSQKSGSRASVPSLKTSSEVELMETRCCRCQHRCDCRLKTSSEVELMET